MSAEDRPHLKVASDCWKLLRALGDLPEDLDEAKVFQEAAIRAIELACDSAADAAPQPAAAQLKAIQDALVAAFYDPDPTADPPDPLPGALDYSQVDWLGVIADARRLLDQLKAQLTTAQEQAARQIHHPPSGPLALCPVFRPDHNGECLHCDEPITEHTRAAILAGQALLAGVHEMAVPLHDADARIPSYRCPRCGAVSYNLHDIAERYCGACHAFETL